MHDARHEQESRSTVSGCLSHTVGQSVATSTNIQSVPRGCRSGRSRTRTPQEINMIPSTVAYVFDHATARCCSSISVRQTNLLYGARLAHNSSSVTLAHQYIISCSRPVDILILLRCYSIVAFNAKSGITLRLIEIGLLAYSKALEESAYLHLNFHFQLESPCKGFTHSYTQFARHVTDSEIRIRHGAQQRQNRKRIEE